MSRKSTKQSTGRLFWRRFLGSVLAACLLLLLIIALREGALGDLAGEFLPGPDPTAGLSFHMIDVGQGQALLLTCGGKSAMIDAGLPGTADEVVNYLWSHRVRRLDYLFITHPHSDHCGGAKDVAERIGTQMLIIPAYYDREALLTDAGDWVGNTDAAIAVAGAGETFALGEATITVLHPAADNRIEDMNDLSLVLLVEYAGKRLLLTGDLTENLEPSLLPIGPVDVLQVGHHGSYTSSSQEFLEDIRPRYALISCGKNNDYGHPHNVVIARLEDVGAEIFRTDEQGTLVVSLQEDQITIETENK